MIETSASTAGLRTQARAAEPRATRQPSARVRWRVLAQLERALDVPMAILGLIWLVLFIVDVTRGSSPLVAGASTAIWILFIGDFTLRLVLAPDRAAFLRGNLLTVLSLIVPALRLVRFAAIFRALRAARAVRGVRLVRTVASLNRGMRALATATRRQGVYYVIPLAVAVTFAGAAGMYTLEPQGSQRGFAGYGDALWWTSMIMTTMGSAYWPQTAEGRVLAFLLSLFAIGVFGYITAMLASFFIDRDAASRRGSVGSAADLQAIRRELAALRRELGAASRPSP